MSLPWLDPQPVQFPPLTQALTEPDGLLAAGGDLSQDWLLHAYGHGIFPWFEEGQPILWWSPDPRLVLFPARIHLARSLRKLINKHSYVLTMDKDFAAVIRHCGMGRGDAQQTWITPRMESAYCHLHELGHAHSVEVWNKDELIGGLYGVALGKVFFGESMFSKASNGSKLALVALAQQLHRWDFALIDCQVRSDHLLTLGAEEIPRSNFIELLSANTQTIEPGLWQFDADFELQAGQGPE